MKLPRIALASFVTLTAMSMTAVAAFDRGGTAIDRAILVSMSIVIVLAVHLLPALSRRPVAWLVWTGCLLCAIYGHITFLTFASLRAGEVRAQESALTVGIGRQIDITREALAQINARPVATVAAELATTKGWRERAALRVEIAEGRRAEALRADLVHLAGVSTTAQVSGSVDPVTARLAEVTGYSQSGVSVVIGLTFSILIELIGALLWVEALRPSGEAAAVPVALPADAGHHIAEDVTGAVTDPVTAVTSAIEAGKLRPTVAGIRSFLNCSQARAMELRREIVAEPA